MTSIVKLNKKGSTSSRKNIISEACGNSNDVLDMSKAKKQFELMRMNARLLRENEKLKLELSQKAKRIENLYAASIDFNTRIATIYSKLQNEKNKNNQLQKLVTLVSSFQRSMEMKCANIANRDIKKLKEEVESELKMDLSELVKDGDKIFRIDIDRLSNKPPTLTDKVEPINKNKNKNKNKNRDDHGDDDHNPPSSGSGKIGDKVIMTDFGKKLISLVLKVLDDCNTNNKCIISNKCPIATL